MSVPWEEEPFLSLIAPIRGVTVIDPIRLRVLYDCCRAVEGLPGDAAELGVYRGGSARLIAQAMPGRTLRLFDTFAGMPAADPRADRHKSGDFADTSLPRVREFLSGLAGVTFHPGTFPETACGERFCLVHVDADLRASIEAACAWFWPRMVPGGIILFDDYNAPSCPGVRPAVDAFFAAAGRPILALPTKQAVAWAR